MVKKFLNRLLVLLMIIIGIYFVTINISEKEVKKIENSSIR